MDQRISLITLGVADLGRAMGFYSGLGWEGASPDGDVAFYQAGGMVFALWSRAKLQEDSAVADDPGLDFGAKLTAYAKLADDYFEVDRYREFCATSLASLPELVHSWIASTEFDDLLLETVRNTYPAHEHDSFAAHFRGLLSLWVNDNA